MTRLGIGTWTPATPDPLFPNGKSGYHPSKPVRDISEIEYIVAHDARGFRGYLVNGHRKGERASWSASNLTDGGFLEHYEVEDPTWISGTMEANVKGYGFENENERYLFFRPADRLVTNPQIVNVARVYTRLKELGAPLLPPVLGEGFREHRMFSSSSCPNKRFGAGEGWDAVAIQVASMEAAKMERPTCVILRVKKGETGAGKKARYDWVRMYAYPMSRDDVLAVEEIKNTGSIDVITVDVTRRTFDELGG